MVEPNAGYTIVSQTVTRDPDLTCRERGLLLTLLSLPDDWKYSVEGLATILPESKTQITSILGGLEDKGYVIRTKIQDSKGRFSFEWKIFDKPQIPTPGNQSVEIAQNTAVKSVHNPQAENPVLDNPSLDIPELDEPVVEDPVMDTIPENQIVDNKQNTVHEVSDNVHSGSSDVHIAQISKPVNVHIPQVKNPVLDNPPLDEPVLDDPVVDLQPQSNTKGVITKDDINPHLHTVDIYNGADKEDGSSFHSINQKAYQMYGMSGDAAKVYALLNDEFNASLNDKDYHHKLAGMGYAEIDHIYAAYCGSGRKTNIKYPDSYIRAIIRNTAISGYKPASIPANNIQPKRSGSKPKYRSNRDYGAMLAELDIIGQPPVNTKATHAIT